MVTESYNELDTTAGISENMKPLLSFSSNILFIYTALDKATANATDLQNQVNTLETNLTTVKTNIENAIMSNCSDPDCIEMVTTVKNVNVTVDYTNISNAFTPLIGALHIAIARNLDVELEAGYNEFQAIVNDVNNSVNGQITEARQAAEQVGRDISVELDNIQGEMDSIDFNETVQDIQDVTDVIKEPTDYALYGMGGLAGLILLIVLFGYLGLLFGCFCPQPKPGKDDTCCTKKVGATCLLAGVGFTFIFFWIFMILLIALMLTGGLLHTELCRHLVDLDESPVMTIMDELMNDTLFKDLDFFINISDIYSNCRNNEAFYTALNVEETFGFDLDTILDTSSIESEIENIRNEPINIGPISIITPSAVTLLTGLAKATENSKGEIQDAITELKKQVTSEDLGQLADDLETFNQGRNVPGLPLYIGRVRDLDTDTEDINDQKQITVNELTEVDEILSASNLTAITIDLQKGNSTVNNEGEDIIEAVIDDTTYRVEGYINVGVSTINSSVRYEIGKCAPVYNAYSVMVDSGCVEVLYPVNGYWFALGWSLFYLIIGIIMSFKLTTLYRRTYRHKKAIYPDVGYGKVKVAVIT